MAIPLLAVLLVPMGYYAVAKLTYGAYSCGSFAELDAEIGWVLKPAVDSCLGGRAMFSATPWLEAPVRTDKNGVRAAGGETAVGGLMAVGDSYTFGYGVGFEQSYPSQLAPIARLPVVDAASPAYSSAQALLLARRWVGRLRPKAIVYLDTGIWQRAACRGPYRRDHGTQRRLQARRHDGISTGATAAALRRHRRRIEGVGIRRARDRGARGLGRRRAPDSTR
jgi:hypothetical protein